MLEGIYSLTKDICQLFKEIYERFIKSIIVKLKKYVEQPSNVISYNQCTSRRAA